MEKNSEKIAHAYLDDVKAMIAALEKQLDTDNLHVEEFWPVLSSKFRVAKLAIDSVSLQNVWKLAATYSSPTDSFYSSHLQDGQSWLANAISASFPSFVNLCSKSEADKWQQDVIKKTAELVSLLKATPANYLGNNLNYEQEIMNDFDDSCAAAFIYEQKHWIEFLNIQVDSIAEPEQEDIKNMAKEVTRVALHSLELHSPTRALGRISKAYSRKPVHEAYWLKRRTGSDSERAYFVRVLTRGMLGRTGQAKRDVVAEIANQVFDGNITPQQVIGLTKDIVKNPSDLFDHTKRGFFTGVLDEIYNYRL